MLKFVGRKMSQVVVAANTDKVVGAHPLPQGGSIDQIDIIMKCTSPSGAALPMGKVVMYGVDVYVVPQPDPDSSITYDQAWNRFVPKDDAPGTILNLDTTVADATPVMVQGQLDINAMFNMTGLAPKRIFRRRRMLSFADLGPTVGSQAVDTWTPAEAWNSTINRRVRVNQPSYVLIGFSSPPLTQTSVNIWVPPVGTSEWAILQYMEKFLEDAFVSSLAMIDAGAESPYDTAEEYIQRLLEDIILEETTDAFHPQSWTVHTQSTFQVTVPGRLNLGRKVLTSDMG